MVFFGGKLSLEVVRGNEIVHVDAISHRHFAASVVVPGVEVNHWVISTSLASARSAFGVPVVLSWGVVLKDPHTVDTTGVGDVVGELKNWNFSWAVIVVNIRACRSLWWIDPETETSRTGSVVSSHVVVGVDDPETGWCLIDGKKGGGRLGLDGQIVLDVVTGFDSVFSEEGVTHVVVSDVVLEGGVVDSVHGHSAVKSLPDSETSEIRVWLRVRIVEMNWIATKVKGLSCVVNFHVFDLSVSNRVEKHMSTELVRAFFVSESVDKAVLLGCEAKIQLIEILTRWDLVVPWRWVLRSFELDVSGKKTNFSSLVESDRSSIGSCCCEFHTQMKMGKGVLKAERGSSVAIVSDGRDDVIFRLNDAVLVSSWRDSNSVANVPAG